MANYIKGLFINKFKTTIKLKTGEEKQIVGQIAAFSDDALKEIMKLPKDAKGFHKIKITPQRENKDRFSSEAFVEGSKGKSSDPFEDDDPFA